MQDGIKHLIVIHLIHLDGMKVEIISFILNILTNFSIVAMFKLKFMICVQEEVNVSIHNEIHLLLQLMLL